MVLDARGRVGAGMGRGRTIAGFAIAAGVAGRLADRIGALAVVRGSLALTGVVVLLVPLARSFAVVIVLVASLIRNLIGSRVANSGSAMSSAGST